MKNLPYILIVLITLTSFSKKQEKKESFIKCDSVAFKSIENTFNYWEYSKFILKYPESEYFNLALNKYYNTRDQYFDSIGMPIMDCFRNCAEINIKTNQQITFENKPIHKDDLQDSIFKFFCNELYNELKPEHKYVQDVYDIPQEISKGYIQLQYVKDSCAILQAVVQTIHNSIEDYKNYLSLKWYQKEFVDVDNLEKHHLDSLLDNRLLLFGWDYEYTKPLPPPPPPHLKLDDESFYLDDSDIEDFEKAIAE